jgi:hypothetical protein
MALGWARLASGGGGGGGGGALEWPKHKGDKDRQGKLNEVVSVMVSWRGGGGGRW